MKAYYLVANSLLQNFFQIKFGTVLIYTLIALLRFALVTYHMCITYLVFGF
jgi:hypothetical protein